MAENKGPSIIANWNKARFATRNLHGGLRHKFQKEILCEDMRSRNIMVAALQETYIPDTSLYLDEGTRGIIVPMGKGDNHNEHHYGQAFYLSKEAKSRMEGVQRVSNRLSYLRLYASTKENGEKT